MLPLDYTLREKQKLFYKNWLLKTWIEEVNKSILQYLIELKIQNFKIPFVIEAVRSVAVVSLWGSDAGIYFCLE